MNETHHLVTAIVTTHNRAPEMVARAIASVVGQTYRPLEVVVVDDSDADYPLRGAVERAVRGTAPEAIYLRRKDNRGANAARNCGLRLARGYYVAFLDDDDEWFPTKIEQQVRCLDTEDAALVYCRYVDIEDSTGVEYVNDNDRFYRGHVFDELLRNGFVGGTSGPLLKTRCVNEVGGFDELMESSQDYDLWLRIAQRYPVSFVDEPLHVCHIHDGERITTNVAAKIAGQERIIEKYRDWIRHDRDAHYIKLRRLMYHYLRGHRRGTAFRTWLTCVRLKPGQAVSNTKALAMIVLGYDCYASAYRAKAALLRCGAAFLRRCDGDG